MLRKSVGLLLGVVCACGAAGVAKAQTSSPPKVLEITREFTKPGRAGAVHDRSESAFVQAMARAKWPTYYVGATSLTGKSRAIFLVGYDSFGAWEKDMMATNKNATLSAALDHAGYADGDLLSDMDQSVWIYREDESLRPDSDISKDRYLDITMFQVKEGHEADWDQIVQMVKAGFEKADPSFHWATYQAAYGAPDGAFLVITARRSASEIDANYAANPKFMAAMGTDGMKKLDELSASTLESDEAQLFLFNPKMSYPSPEMIEGDMDFWKPKPTATMTAPPASGAMPGMATKKPATTPPAAPPNQ